MTAHPLKILVADDEDPVHRAFRDALAPPRPGGQALAALENELFGAPARACAKPEPAAYDLTFVHKGEQAVEAVRTAQETNAPFGVVFLDMRMPPGIDGSEAAHRIRLLDPFVNIVLVTAFSDIEVSDIAARIPPADKFFFMAKPFQVAEIRQQAAALSARWSYETTLVQDLQLQNDRLRTVAEQARVARFEAEAANIAKSAFLANISHELRTPLNAIIGFSDIMTNQMFGPHGDARYLDYSREISSAGNALLGSVNDIIDTARLDMGKIELCLEPLDLHDCIHRVTGELQDFAGRKSVTLAPPPRFDFGPVGADRRRLHQILFDILHNAIKFSPEGGRVDIAVDRECAGVAIRVRDTGPGISAEVLEAVRRGQLFQNGVNILSRLHGGLGLGLSLAKGLTELHGGRLEIDCTPGQGTTVSLTIPVAREQALA